ncbi:MAG: alpha-1,4-glucan--maltose-1-phosphate maltosyltransferase [Phycisphaerae bacterium]|nr:alpha-1,4-glucan--maltose-1-phosphate maltosyltransferase [Phycisphaerae bacterium]
MDATDPDPRPTAAVESPRLVIERVQPELDGGRYAAKSLLGEPIEVSADIFGAGFSLISARVNYRGPGDSNWSFSPLVHEYGPDRWIGRFLPDRIGRWVFTVQAWIDAFGTWVRDLHARIEAGQDVASELLDGARMIRTALADRSTLPDAARVLCDARTPIDARIRAAGDAELAAAMERTIDDRLRATYERVLPIVVDRERAGVGAWYEFFPRSQTSSPDRHGTFDDAIRALPRIAELGFDVVYLPPIHPIGRTHRKGRNNARVAAPGDPGSVWAIGNEHGGHTAVEPALGTVADFDRFVRAAADLRLEVAIDYALQCSPDHPWIRQHPDWFHVRADGSIRCAENPPHTYDDIVPLNFWCEDRAALWSACRDILRFWIDRGVRIFRVDNPHTKPFAFWEWLIADIKAAHPDVIFLAEAFTRPKPMLGLAKLGFCQSYTYFMWRNTADELREYVTELASPRRAASFRGNFFTNTPDNIHAFLQTGGRAAFRIRLIAAATLSPIYGICSGFELCEGQAVRPDSEEPLDSDIFQIRPRDFSAPGNINDDVAAINRIRRRFRALQRMTNVTFLDPAHASLLYFLKADPTDDLLIVINVNPHDAADAHLPVPLDELRLPVDLPFDVEDVLTGERFTWRGPRSYVRLDPAERVAHIFRILRPPGSRAR